MRHLAVLLTLILIARAADPTPQRFHLTARAHEIDPRAREHPEIDFVFTDKAGKPQDLQHAVVDTRVTPRGQLVIWLMDYKAPLIDRLGDYGLHAIQVHYANKWFGLIPTAARDDGTTVLRCPTGAFRVRLDPPTVTANGRTTRPTGTPRPTATAARSRRWRRPIRSRSWSRWTRGCATSCPRRWPRAARRT
jgi:hypothetical protein